jgi:hypothetical protein
MDRMLTRFRKVDDLLFTESMEASSCIVHSSAMSLIWVERGLL